MHSDFITLSTEQPFQWDIKYSYHDNIVGRPISGYYANKCIMTKPCFEALKKIQSKLTPLGYCLLIWDAYRPYKAVLDFWQWSQDQTDNLNKDMFYPSLLKPELFSQGYFNKTSNHCSGSTVDLTIVDKNNQPLEMGTIFDFMDPLSHPNNNKVSESAQSNRLFLQTLMIDHGFEPIETEWWHFRLIDEPFYNEYFDFDIC